MVTKKKMSKGGSALKAALEDKALAPAAPAASVYEAKGGTERAYRGVNISGHFDKAVQKQIRMLMLQHEKTQRELMAEAFDMLFIKYKLPQIATTAPVEPESAA